jgi:hypothetical protein
MKLETPPVNSDTTRQYPTVTVTQTAANNSWMMAATVITIPVSRLRWRAVGDLGEWPGVDTGFQMRADGLGSKAALNLKVPHIITCPAISSGCCSGPPELRCKTLSLAIGRLWRKPKPCSHINTK